MRMSNHPTYLEIRNWFLSQLKKLIPRFYKTIKEVSLRYGVKPSTVILILQNENLWPTLSPDLYRALTLMQENILWTRVPSLQSNNIDVSNIKGVVLELAITLSLKLFPDLEKRFNNYIDELSISTGESFLDVLEIFERGLAQDNFHMKPIVLGIVATQFQSLRF